MGPCVQVGSALTGKSHSVDREGEGIGHDTEGSWSNLHLVYNFRICMSLYLSLFEQKHTF